MYFRGSSVQEGIREKSSLLKEVPYLLLICFTEVIKRTPYLSPFLIIDDKTLWGLVY